MPGSGLCPAIETVFLYLKKYNYHYSWNIPPVESGREGKIFDIFSYLIIFHDR